MLSFVFCSLFPSDEKRPVSLLDCTHYYPRPARSSTLPQAALDAATALPAAEQLGANCSARISPVPTSGLGRAPLQCSQTIN